MKKHKIKFKETGLENYKFGIFTDFNTTTEKDNNKLINNYGKSTI